MKKWHKIKVFIISLLTILMTIPVASVFAAGTANVSVSSASGNVGEQVTVNVTISSNVDIGATKMYILYDADMLEAVSGGDNRGGGTVMWIDTETYQSKTVTLTFNILKAGTSTISVSSGSQLADMGEDYMQITGSSGTVTGNAPQEASDDNSLSRLEISPGTLSPAFSPDVTSYTATISADTEKLTVSAYPSDSKASVSVRGTRMDVGDNTTTITVTAENGATRSYIIKSYRPASENESNQDETTKASEEASNSTEAPKQNDTDTVTINGIKYALDNDFTIHPLPDGFEEAAVTYENKEINAAKGFNGKVILMYLEASSLDGQSGFYVYDSNSKTFMPYVEVSQPKMNICFLPITAGMELPSGYNITKVHISGREVEILTGNSEEYYLIYGVDQEGNAGWYCYDNKYGTLQRFFAMPDTVETHTKPDDSKTDAPPIQNSANRVGEIIAIIAIVLALATMCVCAYIVVNNTKKMQKMKSAMAETLNFNNDAYSYDNDENE